MLAERLQRFEPFTSADLAERTTIARHARLLELPAGRCFVAGARRAPGSWYLWRGAVRLRANDGIEVRITHDCAAAKRPLVDRHDSNVRAAATIVASTLLYVDVAPIAFLLERRAPPVYSVHDVASDHSHWMHRFLSGGFARRLPPTVLQTLFRSFEPLDASAGANVLRRGAPGDSFFVVRDGVARIATGQGDIELSPGTTFGADALVSGMMRNASVEMVTDGTLLALPAFRFRELIEDPLIERVTIAPRDAVHLDAGRLPRTPTELRRALARLDAGRTYAVSADDVGRARLAVYLLGERDVDAVLLE
jgi:CRP-like cAMP-binding protein